MFGGRMVEEGVLEAVGPSECHEGQVNRQEGAR
jgi:hypothetical protein